MLTRWLMNRAAKNELSTLRQQLSVRQREVAAAGGTRETWLKGAGLAFASGVVGFMADAPPQGPLDARALAALLTTAVAEGLTELATYMRARAFPCDVS